MRPLKESTEESTTYRIGELAHLAGIGTRAIRFYERAGLLPVPARNAAGYRRYGERDLRRLRFIRRAKTLGLSLAEVGQLVAIRDAEQAPCGHLRLIIDQKLAEVRTKMQALKDLERDLLAMQRAAADVQPLPSDDCYCRIIEGPPSKKNPWQEVR